MEFEKLGGIILVVIVMVIVGYFIVIYLWTSAKPLLNLGDELTEDQEKVKFASIETFGKFVNDLEACASAKTKGCICDITKIPEFPKDYELILTKEKTGLKYSLVRVYNEKEIEITSKGTTNFGTLCYITNKEGDHDWQDKIVIKFDKKPFYTDKGRLYDDFKPIYKKFDKSLCLLTDRMGVVSGSEEGGHVNPSLIPSTQEGVIPKDIKNKWEDGDIIKICK